LEDLVADYHSRSFGFASSNFFPELLACIEIEKNAEKYFGKVQRDQPPSAFEVKIPDYIGWRDLISFLKLDSKKVRTLNPGLSEAVFQGRRKISAGTVLRLPSPGTEVAPDAGPRMFFAGYEQIPSVYKQRYGTRDRVNRKRTVVDPKVDPKIEKI
jgi:hypothetical protein